MGRGTKRPETEESSEEPPPIPDIINERFEIKGKIGSGSYSEVYLAHDKVDDVDVAVKLEWVYADKTGKLVDEGKFYQTLEKHHRKKKGLYGAPRILWSGSAGEYNVMVMEILGPSLEDLLKRCGNKTLSLSTVSRVGVQMVDRLEFCHVAGILHRDIKPNNFLMGIGNHKHDVYIMDFGLAKKYLTSDGTHIAESKKKGLTGTVRYTSKNIHKGIEPSRRDELTSVAYVLIYLLLGRLPWQGINADSKRTKQRRIGKRKNQVDNEDLCKDIPHEFVKYLTYCEELGFRETPDYEYLKKLLKDAGKGAKHSKRYDWERLDVFDGTAPKPEKAHKRKSSASKTKEDKDKRDAKRRRKEDLEPGKLFPEIDNDDKGKCFVWKVPAQQIRGASKGDRVESQDFPLEGTPGTFRLRYWPKGHKKAAESSCSAYIWAEKAGTMQMRLYVNGKCKILDKDGPVFWKDSNDRGYADFCTIPEEGDNVYVSVVLMQGAKPEEEEEADDKDEYEYEYYSDNESDEDSEEESTTTTSEEEEIPEEETEP